MPKKAQRDERNKVIARMFMGGASVPDIGQEVDLSPAGVYTVIATLGLTRPHVKRARQFPGSTWPERLQAAAAAVEKNRIERDAKYIAIRDKYAAGATLGMLGKEYGCTREWIRLVLKRLGYTERHRGFHTEVRQAVRERRAAQKAVSDARKAARQARIDKVRELYDAGVKYKDITKELGLGLRIVQEYIRLTGGVNRIKRGMGKLSDADRLAVADRYAAGDAVGAIAKAFDISEGYVSVLAAKYKRRRNSGPEAMRRFKEASRRKHGQG